MAEILGGLVASTAVGACVGSMLQIANKGNPIASSTAISAMLIYPTFIFPFGLFSESLVKKLTLHYTPFDFQKQVRDKPQRLTNYLYNKRYMMVDLPLGQVVMPFVMATGVYYLLKSFENRLQSKFTTEGQQVKSRLKESDVIFLVKARWLVIMGRIMGELAAGYRDTKGYRHSFRGQAIAGAGLNMIWHFIVLQTFLDGGKTVKLDNTP